MNQSNQNSSKQKQQNHAYNWLNDHGQVSFEDLKNLAQEGTPEASERLRQLAADNNIYYDENTDLMKLAQEISRAMETKGNIGVE